MTPGRWWYGLTAPLSLAIALLLSGPLTLLRAEPDPDPVEALKKHLEATSQPPVFPQQEQMRQWMQEREKTTQDLLARIKTPGDLARALLLLQWGDERQRRQTQILERLLPLLRSSLEGQDPFALAAAATQVGYLLTAESSLPLPHRDLTRRLEAVIPVVADQLKHSDPLVRSTAARTLGQYPLQAATILPLAGQLDKEREASVAEMIARVLGEGLTREVTPTPAGTWEGNRGEQIGTLVAALGKGTSHATEVGRRTCQQQLKDVTKGVWTWASWIVEERKRPSFDQPPELVAMKKKEHAAFAKTLQILQEQIPAILRGLEDTEAPVVLAAHETLEALGDLRSQVRLLPPAPVAPQPNPKKQAQTDRGSQKEQGAQQPPARNAEQPGRGQRSSFGDDLKQAVPALQRSLNQKKEIRLRLAALYALEAIEEDALPTIGSLLEALKEDNLFIRWGAARVLANLAPRADKEVVPVLADHLQDPDADVRATIVLALKRYGPRAAPATAKLAEVIRKGDLEMRQDAIRAVQAIGPAARSATPALIEALSAKELEMRYLAAVVLGQISPTEKSTREALARALLDPESEVRRAASASLLAAPPE